MKKVILLFIAIVTGCLAAFYFSGNASNGILSGDDSIAIPEFPQPQLIRSYIQPSAVPSSWMTLPVKLSIDDLQSLTNRNLLRQYNGNVEYLDGTIRGKLNYRLRREEDARVTVVDGKIRISLPIKFNVRFVGNVLAAIVRVPFSAQTEGALNLYITVKPSVGRDWSIKTEAEVDFTWTKPPKLTVTGIQVGLQGESDRFLREAIRDNLYKIDDIINKEVKLREMMQREWDNLVVPVKVADSVYLHFDPRGVSASSLDITPKEVTLKACIETGISLSMGMGDITTTRKKRLPPLEEYIPTDELISLNVKALLNYDSLEQEATKALSGVKIDMGITSVTVGSLRLMGSGESLIAAFEVNTSTTSGTIYAIGEPYFDEDTRVLYIKNFDFEAGVREGLIRTAAWLLRPMLMNTINEKLRWELGPQIDKLTSDARDAIASREINDEFELKGTLKSVKFNQLRVTGQGIEIGLNLEGAATLMFVPRD